MSFKEINDLVDETIEKVRVDAGFDKRRSKCRKAVISFIILFKQFKKIPKDVVILIAKTLYTTKYDSCWT